MSVPAMSHAAVPSPETAPAQPGRRWRFSPGRPVLLLNLAGILALYALWAVATETGFVSPLFFPSPSMVVTEARGIAGTADLWISVFDSSRRVLAGFGLAAAVAVPLGILMGSWWPAKAVIDPLISLLRPLPSITWIPLTMLWLGIGEGQKVAIVFMGCWIYILLYTVESTKCIDPLLIKAARNLRASHWAVMREVVLPGSLPGILAGLKVSLAIAWSCVLSAEMVAARTGLGALIWSAKDWGNTPLVLVGMICISATVLIADLAANWLETWLLPWERHRRGR
jgi:taurine transport system permease protein